MKSILIICILLTLQIDAKTSSTQKFTKQIVHCPDGSKSFILSKDDIYYSASYKKFLFLRKAGRDSCKQKNIRTKKGTTVCTRKKDIYRMLKGRINKSSHTHKRNYSSCLKLKRSVPLKIIDHFPFTSQITYYKVKYQDKVLYVSSQDVYNIKKHHAKKYKKRHKERTSKRQKKTRHHKKRTKSNHRKKHISNHNNRLSTHKKSKKQNDIPTTGYSYAEPSIAVPIQNSTTSPTIETLPEETNTDSYETSLVKELNTKQNYTYRCIAVYGDNRITVDNSYSMSDASDSVWRRCQALKSSDEVCKIKDCYKLIK